MADDTASVIAVDLPRRRDAGVLVVPDSATTQPVQKHALADEAIRWARREMEAGQHREAPREAWKARAVRGQVDA